VQRLAAVFLFFALLAPAYALDYAANIASLIDPTKLATLKARGANPRVQKHIYWLEAARIAGEDLTKVAQRAVSLAGYRNAAAQLTMDALLRNLKIATELGCLDLAGEHACATANHLSC
jgi:hypothetical protein